VLDMTEPRSVQASKNIAISIHGRPAQKGRVMNHRAKRCEKPVVLRHSFSPKQPIRNKIIQLPKEAANAALGVITPVIARSAMQIRLG